MPWGVAAAAGATVLGGLMTDDNGAEGANNAAADANATNAQIARDQWERYKTVYAPLEDAYVNEAQNYDSSERYAMEAGKAQATVAQQYGKARDRLTRTPGLDPSSAGYAANMTNLDLSQAAGEAIAQNTARRAVADTAWARKTDALSLGKNLPAQASSTLSTVAQQSASLARDATARSNAEAAGIGGVVRDVVGGVQNLWNGANGSTAVKYGTLPGSQQTSQLAAQEYGL